MDYTLRDRGETTTMTGIAVADDGRLQAGRFRELF